MESEMVVDTVEQGGGLQLPHRSLACSMCRRRKIRCDRGSPCSNCWKFDLHCEPAAPSFARKEKRRAQDLRERLARCEELLEWFAHASPSSSHAHSLQGDNKPSTASSAGSGLGSAAAVPPSPAPDADAAAHLSGLSLDSPGPAKRLKPAGRLIMEDGTFKFTDRWIWSSIQDNLRAMREIIENEGIEEPCCDDTETLDSRGAADIEDLVPAPAQIFRLWQVFIERVNPLTKLIHVPTFQHVVVEATEDHSGQDFKVQALLFAIYLSATLSMSDGEARRALGTSRDESRKRFTLAVKKCLVKANFLKNYDLTVLQAFVLFIISLQGHFDRHALWILCGAMVRMAQKMGLHRDGEHMNLPPFETEMRRRLWWQIILLDCKCAVHSGLIDAPILPWDTKFPSNVNDADIYPPSTEPVQPREGPTEMVFCLIFYEIANFFIHNREVDFEDVVLCRLDSDPTSPTYSAGQAARAKIRDTVDRLEEKICDVEKRYCNPSMGPIHVLASTLRPLILNKMRTLLIPMQETPEWGSEINNIGDHLFRVSVCCEEINLACLVGSKDRHLAWFFKLHFELESFFSLVSQVYKRTTGSLVERAWSVINRTYESFDDLWDMSLKANVSLANFVVLAWKTRESALAQIGLPCEVPSCVARLRSALPSSSMHTPNSSLANYIPPQQEARTYQEIQGQRPRSWNLWEEMGTSFVGLGNLGTALQQQPV